MFSVAADWNPRQAELRGALADPVRFGEAMEICLELHAMVHSAAVGGAEALPLMDELWGGLTREAFAIMPTAKDVTIAWDIWHVTRIEDLCANILIAGRAQVFDDFAGDLGTEFSDTGNAMTDEEIISLSRGLNMGVLRGYRDAVGRATREIIGGLSPADIKRRVMQEDTARILAEGGVTEHKDSVWLLDFWGRKTVAGLLLMPITRHQVGHLNDARRLKKRLMKL